MRLLCIILATIVFLSITGCQTRPSKTDKEILKNLSGINQKLDIISKQLTEVYKEIESPEPPLPTKLEGFTEIRADIRRLGKIKLPLNPNNEQVEEYIANIIKASARQNCFSQSDPQVSMIQKLDSKHIDILLRYANNLHVQYALPYIVTEKNKKQILEVLNIYPQLLNCVIKNRWEKDARKTIFTGLKSRQNLPDQWFVIAAKLANPQDYETLEYAFVHSNTSPRTNYNALIYLDDFDIKKAVNKAWKYQKISPHSWYKKQMAMIAAQYGHNDALEYIIKAYLRENQNYISSQLLSKIYQLTGKNLSPKKMYKWYKKNKGKLVFDPKDQIYVIKKQ